MLPLREWLATEEIQKIKAEGPGPLVTKTFFRDPFRDIHRDTTAMYAPADGIILYALERIKPTDPIVEIKGRKFDVREALDDPEYDTPSLVIGIFMTQYDVHINRMPTDGYLVNVGFTPFLFTPNVSMVLEEKDILENAVPQVKNLDYLFQNERQIVKVYNPDMKGSYYLIQIVEREVNTILNWGIGDHLSQGERYGLVRWGSQVDLIIPLNGKIKYEILAKKNHHVEAGIDEIIRIINP
jgi:phosphatidylserine decarboxylase